MIEFTNRSRTNVASLHFGYGGLRYCLRIDYVEGSSEVVKEADYRALWDEAEVVGFFWEAPETDEECSELIRRHFKLELLK